MNNETINRINNRLLEIPGAKLVQGNRWIIIRCMYCGDSLNSTHAHFGIHLPVNEDDLYYFNCFKCHTTGRLTTDTLMTFGIFDVDIISGLSNWNKRVLSRPENRIFKDQIYMVKNSHINQSKLTDAKLNYINNRLGINMTYKDILDKKIILNINDLLDENHITKLTRDPNVVKQLDGGFLGFLSQDNAFINMRRLVNEEKVMEPLRKRYVNYNLFGKFDNTQKYYTIPTTIRLDNPKKIKLKIAEGPFDILSIFYNLSNQDTDNCIYSSITGSGYINILEFFLIKKRLINMEVDIYMDSDIKERVLYAIKQLLDYFGVPLRLHRNIYPGEKDFGVKHSKIQDQILNI